MSQLLPPLSLYAHIPWCVKKCPYCDFNSHAQKQAIDELSYIKRMLEDLRLDAEMAQGRPIDSIFIGGGTPSLFSADSIASLLDGINNIVPIARGAEITLEANPGTAESEKFKGFRKAGINRLSIGIQSFNKTHLQALGRIHDDEQALRAIEFANAANFNSYNLDLMHGLPHQTVDEAIQDIQRAIASEAKHISWYQLTLEPNTEFYQNPPPIPAEERLWDIQEAGMQLLNNAGFNQYEVSAFSQPDFESRHNINYWTFGDYLAIGAGAHGKVTRLNQTSSAIDRIERFHKQRHPKAYADLTKPITAGTTQLSEKELPLEFFMNLFRLKRPTSQTEFSLKTGLPWQAVAPTIKQLEDKELVELSEDSLKLTEVGFIHLNTVLEHFI